MPPPSLSVAFAAAAALLLISSRGALAGDCTPVLPALGCFDDEKGPHAVADEVGSAASVAGCVQQCGQLGYRLSGLTGNAGPPAQVYCYCGSAVDGNAVPAPAGDCSLPCPAGGAGTCGGNYRLAVYNSSCTGPMPPPPGPGLNGTACSQPESAAWAFCNKSLTVEERVADLVARLTLYEIGPQLTARSSPAIPRLGIPSYYWGLNMVHGVTNPVDGGVLCVAEKCVSIFPAGAAQGASWNATAWREMGRVAATEMRALNNLQWGPAARPGVGMDALVSWGPTINLQRDPRWGRNQETPSSDPRVLSAFAVALVRGMQEGEDPRYVRVGTTLKHFAAYSLEDYHTPSGDHVTRENLNAVVSPFDLHDSYYPHFKAAVSPVAAGGGGAVGVMMAMNAVGTSAGNTDMVPCTASHPLTGALTDWARLTNGPPGVPLPPFYITSDGGNMISDMVNPEPDGHGWCPYHAPPCNIDEAVKAAAEARCAIADGNEYMTHTVSSILAGNVSEASIRLLVADTMRVRMRLGLFDNLTAADSPYLAYGLESLASPSAQEANRVAAYEAMTLLQKGALPFARGGVTAVIGFGANSTRNLVGNYVNQFCASGDEGCPAFPSIFAAIVGLGETATYSRGCANSQTCAAADIAAAVASVSGAARVVLQLGLDQTIEAEQKDRASVALPQPQQDLFAAVLAAAGAKPLAVVMLGGGAVAIPAVKASLSTGILDAFYPGTFGGRAVADTLFGVANPGGKLPHDIYDVSYDSVDFTNMSVAALQRTYRYNAGASSPGGAPLWAFGFGLSYTTFAVSWREAPPAGGLTVTAAAQTYTLRLTLANTGAADGAEVVQVYVVPQAATLAPQPPFVPTRYVVAFARVPCASAQQASVDIAVDLVDALTITADVMGARTLVSGQYALVVNRGAGAGDELSVPVTVVA
jgi:beta-D-xylosidase 4